MWRDVKLSYGTHLATSVFTTADQTSVVSVILISCNIPVCCNRVTGLGLKADPAPYTFYICGSQQVKVGIMVSQSINI